MRIGIDCRTVLAPKTGDRTYTLNLLRGLSSLAAHGEIPPDWSFQLLLDRPDREDVLPRAPVFETLVLPAPRGSSRLWTLWTLPRYAKRTRPDLIHLQYIAPAFLPCPFVTTVHDTVWEVLPQTFPFKDRLIMRALMPGTIRRAAHVLTVSESARRDIARYLPIRRSKISVTPNAVDPAFQMPSTPEYVARVRLKYGLDNAPYVLSVGVLQPRKNVSRLIEAFESVKRRHPDWPHRLTIVGKHGWGESSLGVERPVFIIPTGYVADEELPALYAGAEVFGYPSLYEGFGLPVLEAMACGTPVLTSDLSSLPEIAGDAALLVNPRSVESIAAGLERLLEDATLRDDLRTRGRERAALFTPERQARATIEAYREVVEPPRAKAQSRGFGV